MKKAVILARVSTKEQEETGLSIPAQLQRLYDYAERKGIEVDKEFAFSESAGTKIRKKFEEVVAYIRKNKDVNILLCQNVDRATRNFKDAVDLDEMRIKEGLEIHFVQENLIINAQSTGTDMFVWEAKVFIGKQYLNRISDDSKRSQHYKVSIGEWIGIAPLGYINSNNSETGRPTKGLVKCARCGCAYSSYEKKGHVYLRPTKSKGPCDCKPIKEEQLLEDVSKILSELELPESTLEAIRYHLQQQSSNQKDFHRNSVRQLTNEYSQIDKKLENLLHLFLNGSITQQQYDKTAKELKLRQYEINSLVQNCTEADEQFDLTLIRLINISAKARKYFESSKVEQKRQIIKFALSNLQLESGKLLYELNKPFTQILKIRSCPIWYP